MGFNKIQHYDEECTKSLSLNYKEVIVNLGEDPTREGLLKTSEPVAKAMQFLTQGYDQNPQEILKSAMFAEKYDEMVIVKDIEVYSLCEHHMLPFIGKCHIAYIPNGRIVGLSKFPRMVDTFSRGLQVQERLTDQIRDYLDETLNPQGVAVCIEAQHLCMQMRGVQKQNSITTTSAFSGAFMEEDITRQEFMSLVKGLSR